MCPQFFYSPQHVQLVQNHAILLLKSSEDIEALRGLTLSFIALGARITADLAVRQEKRSSDLEILRQTSFLSSMSSGSTETPRSENPTPVSDAGNIAITDLAGDDITVSPTPEMPSVDIRTVQRSEVCWNGLESSFCLILDWLIDWLIDWSIEWLSDWVIDWLIDWLICSLPDWVKPRLCYGRCSVYFSLHMLVWSYHFSARHNRHLWLAGTRKGTGRGDIVKRQLWHFPVPNWSWAFR